MVRNMEKKWPCLILLAYLVLAVTGGSFLFSASEVSNHVDLETGRSVAAGFFSSPDYSLDWLAENTAFIRKANKYSSSPLRNGFYRIFTSILIDPFAIYVVNSHYPLINNDNTLIYKNNILLKLRI